MSPSPRPSGSPQLSDLASSPTPTVRNVSTSTIPPFNRSLTSGSSDSNPGEGGPSTIAAIAEARRKSDTRASQEELGKGRPGREERLYPAPLSPSVHRGISPSRFSEYSTDDDLYSPDLRPKTAAPRYGMSSMGDQTPRVGAGSQRGLPPATSMGSSFGSPQTQQSVGGSAPRPSRLPRNHSTSGHPLSYPVNPNASTHGYGSTSRSTSRARPALSTQNTAFQVATLSRQAKGGLDEEDEPIVDRGEDLIRRRQAERKQARRKKERERRFVAGEPLDSAGLGGPMSGNQEDSFQQQQQRSLGPAAGRSVSRNRAPSATRGGRREASEGYFASYAGSVAGSETPMQQGGDLLSPRAALRPASIYSSAADEDEEEERDMEREIEDVVADVVEEATVDGGNSDNESEEEEGEDGDEGSSEEGVTLRDRQDAINIEHPFGLPIWKPALYRKSRSVTRNAESALHSIPSAAAERHLLPGNLAWVLLFGWWLAITCFIVAMLVSGAEVCGGGRGGYGKTLRGLAWYIGWPFGKYVEGEGAPEEGDADGDDTPGVEDAESGYGGMDDTPTRHRRREASDGAASNLTIRQTQTRAPAHNLDDGLPDEPRAGRREATVSFAATADLPSQSHIKRSSYDEDERAPLLTGTKKGFRRPRNKKAKMLGRIVYWPLFLLILAPIMLCICTICWFCVFTIPMAKLNWALLHLLWSRPLEINFRSAPKTLVPVPAVPSPSLGADGEEDGAESGSTTLNETSPSGGFRYRTAQLKAGQVAPTSGPTSTVLLCTYRAFGMQYYKYTVGGVNIMFINLLPLVFFTIFDAFVLLPAVERDEHAGRHVSPFLAVVASQALIFVLSLASVIPLSYFIGMAVASISAQSSIGMGAVINATFGSIIEIILYSVALTQGKGRLVEGSIVGSILAGVLLMPGASMCSGAFKRKEQKFNAKSAGVTSTMLIMAIIGTLTPTMFYQTYGTFELHCDGCPPIKGEMTTLDSWKCSQCYYEHPDPVDDPFYQDQVKTLMYCCAGILLFSYLIGLWFSLRTHASQIWQNPQQLLKPDDVLSSLHPAMKASLSQRMTPQAVMQHILPLHKDNKLAASASAQLARGLGYDTAPNTPTQASQAAFPHIGEGPRGSGLHATLKLPKVAELAGDGAKDGEQAEGKRASSATYNIPSGSGYTPLLDGLSHVRASTSGSGSALNPNHERLTPIRLPSSLTTEDFTRAVAVATVSALRHQGSVIGGVHGSGRKDRPASLMMPHPKKTGGEEQEGAHGDGEGEGGGHEAPEWTRGVSAGVLLSCTLLYAIIAEILVDVVDVVLHGIKIDEKFLGLTLFALVPNTTEFMNAMSFALNGNIALSMEIGSAYALQVCLLQIPAMVAFSAFYDPGKMGQVVDTFTLIFPRWDVIAIILSIFLLTYTYIEARSNYHRGSILVLAYIVLVMGFYFAPMRTGPEDDAGDVIVPHKELLAGLVAGGGQWAGGITKLWA